MIASTMAPEEASKPKRPRRAYDVDPEVHEALVRRAARLTLEFGRNVSYSEALGIILRGDLADELAELSQLSQRPASPGNPPRPRKKPG